MSDISKVLDAWVEENKDLMIETLMDFVRIPSVSRADLCEEGAPYGKDVKRMLDYALNRAEEMGFKSENHDGYCGSVYYGDKEEEIGFYAHLDVVPEGNGWIYAPYEPVIENGFVIGRGANDNKAAAIHGLFIMKFLKDQGITLNKTFRVMFGCAEETGMDDFRSYMKNGGKMPSFGIVADCGFPVCYAQKGGWNSTIMIPKGNDIVDFNAGNVRNAIPDLAELTLNTSDIEKVKAFLSGNENIEVSLVDGKVKVIAHGKGGHAASPAGTNNAIVILATALKDLEGFDLSALSFIAETFKTPYGDGMGFKCSDEISGDLTSNIGVVSVADGKIKCELDCRYPVTIDIEVRTDAFKKYLAENNVEMTMLDIEKPFYIEKDDPKVISLQQMFTEVTGLEIAPYTMGGGTYSRVIPNAISFGPGLPNGEVADFLPEGHGSCHAPDEVQSIHDLLQAFKIYVLSILKLGEADV